MLHSEVHVELGSENIIAGRVETGPEQSSLQFFPQTPWQAGKYQLVLGSVLEDLAGNSLQRPFAVDLTGQPPAPVAHFVHLEFDVSSPSAARKAKSP